MTADPCLGCQRLEDPACNTVQLLNGRTVCTWCPGWREETAKRHREALEVLGQPTKAARQAYLASVGKVQGALAEERLRADVLALWEARRAATTAEA